MAAAQVAQRYDAIRGLGGEPAPGKDGFLTGQEAAALLRATLRILDRLEVPYERQRRYGGGTYRRYDPHNLLPVREEAAALMKQGANRREAARAAAKRKAVALLELVDTAEIHVRLVPLDDVMREAEAAATILGATADATEENRARWAVNYVRHELTRYDAGLDALVGKVGCGDARERWIERIFEAIAEAYPDLEVECDRQLAARLKEALFT